MVEWHNLTKLHKRCKNFECIEVYVQVLAEFYLTTTDKIRKYIAYYAEKCHIVRNETREIFSSTSGLHK